MDNEIIPIRVEIEWRHSESGNVIIFQKKKLSRIEEKIANILNAPKKVKRKLDEMNSKLWLLMDGCNTLLEIVNEMENTFSEQIIPANERVIKSIENFVNLGLVRIVKSGIVPDSDIKSIE